VKGKRIVHASGATPSASGESFISVGREICGELSDGLRREWLVTNGLGGYASGTLAGPLTRRYHGLLVAALTPPVGRTVLVGGVVEWATHAGQRYPLSAHEYVGGTIDPQGYRYLQTLALEGTIPVWTFAVADALLERRIWMAHGANTTYVEYRLARGEGEVALEITPLVTYRDFHTLRSGHGWQPQVTPGVHEAEITFGSGTMPLLLHATGGSFTGESAWWWNFRHREEAARGLDDRSDFYAPGTFTLTVSRETPASLVCSVEPGPELDAAQSLAAERVRQTDLLRRAGAKTAPAFVRQLILAADQFVVARNTSPPAPSPTGGGDSCQQLSRQDFTSCSPVTSPEGGGGSGASPLGGKRSEEASTGRTIIAGYPWFNDWGRDTMIALPGLTLATGRPEIAAEILRTFARFVVEGQLPNNFPNTAGAAPGYNTCDATLWYVMAIRSYVEATGDRKLIDELLPVLRDIVERHVAGTRYGIGIDTSDALLRAGVPGVQLTWMDAKVGDWVVTPRIGKPVEINALWYNVLHVVSGWLEGIDPAKAGEYAALAGRVRASFRARFAARGPGPLADVVDGPGGDDWSLRPNQIFGVSLPFPLLEGEEAAAVVTAVGRALLTTYGLRSLSLDDPDYRGQYEGDQPQRDGAYHQGTVWAWLIGAYAEAYAGVHGDPAAALALVQPFAHHLGDAGLGSISEIFDGDPPHLPRGCIAQAWSVAEVLRVWRRLEDSWQGGREVHGG
jgi:glycogen debranching enzyme